MRRLPNAYCQLLIAFAVILTSCEESRDSSAPIQDEKVALADNVLASMTDNDLLEFEWLNPPEAYSFNKGVLRVVAGGETDFFNNPEDSTRTATAPYLYKEMTGNFIATALVRPDFSSQWNAVSVIAYMDADNWIKFAFENSDATGKSIVTVVTRDVSDDANGVILGDHDQVWLKLIRKDNIFSMLWSADSENFKMARLSAMPAFDTVRIGMEFQCPEGEAAEHEVSYFNVKSGTVSNLRAGE